MSLHAATGGGRERNTTGGEGCSAGGSSFAQRAEPAGASRSPGGSGGDAPGESRAAPPSIHDQLIAAMQAAEVLHTVLMAEVSAGRSNLRHAQRIKRDMAAAIRSLAYLRDHGAAIKSAVAYMRAQPDLVRQFADAGAEIYEEKFFDGSTADTVDAESPSGHARGDFVPHSAIGDGS